jgi:hypothetical protein
MQKKKTPLRDPVSREFLLTGLRELANRNFASWTVSPTESAVLEIADGLEQVAKGLRNLARAGI